MNDKDKEAFDNWIDNDVLSHDDNNKFKNMSEQERVVFVTERTWKAALEYERFNHRYCVVGLVEKLQAENKKLREALEFYENCTRLMLDVRDLPKDPVLGYSIVSSKSIMDNGDVAREALKEVGEK